MIGPSSSGSSSTGGQHPRHRALLDELDIESICDEVCGHHHHNQQRSQTTSTAAPNKRPRLLPDFQLLDHHEVLGLPCADEVFAPYFDSPELHHQEQLQQILGEYSEAPVAKLEVLVVDGTWDDALDSFEAVPAPTQLCSTGAPTDPSLQAPQHHEAGIPSLEAVSYGIEHSTTDYWGENQPPVAHHHHQQSGTSLLRQHRHVMPKLHQNHHNHHHHPSPDAGKNHRGNSSGGGGGGGFVATATQLNSYEDQENGNLSWLLDFKLDSFIEAPEDKSTVSLTRDFQGANRTKFNGKPGAPEPAVVQKSCNNNEAVSTATTTTTVCDGAHPPSVPCPGGATADHRNLPATGPKKPPFTYTELIEHALQERGELTVSAIYQWISERFPYYKSNDDRWKNSVRHNLSINPHFRKGSKAPHGAGHLWAIASQDESKPRQLFSIAAIRQALRNEEAAAAAAKANKPEPIDEVAAATASISQPVEEDPEEEENDLVDAITLEHCAEQILSGIKKEVEVQYLVPMMVSSNGDLLHNQQSSGQAGPTHHLTQLVDSLCPIKETDFLNPVSKEVVAEECGLLGEGYLVTDLNPTSLGLNMAESEVVSSDNLFGEELSFQFYEFATAASSQLQSA
ncbi:uncharacterized protein LOC106639858 [Copidosoma floridanum]|uniref:uncharacterized protein LOC106639858 n=1 Tax=Copidosoma floridanum TaxID=29053 RepID=UPI0006C95447|nr:uncharacterized protein LOC106639858 [Copidosoma floridanum]